MIRLRFVTCRDLVSSAIRGGEMGFWASHVEAAMPDGTLLGAHAEGGVQARPHGYDAGEWTRELYVTLPASDEQSAAFEAFLRAEIGKPYDLDAIAEMALGALTGEAPDWRSMAAWICSALQAAALLAAGVIKSAPATVRLATPRDLLMQCSALVAVGEPEAASKS